MGVPVAPCVTFVPVESLEGDGTVSMSPVRRLEAPTSSLCWHHSWCVAKWTSGARPPLLESDTSQMRKRAAARGLGRLRAGDNRQVGAPDGQVALCSAISHDPRHQPRSPARGRCALHRPWRWPRTPADEGGFRSVHFQVKAHDVESSQNVGGNKNKFGTKRALRVSSQQK